MRDGVGAFVQAADRGEGGRGAGHRFSGVVGIRRHVGNVPHGADGKDYVAKFVQRHHRVAVDGGLRDVLRRDLFQLFQHAPQDRPSHRASARQVRQRPLHVEDDLIERAQGKLALLACRFGVLFGKLLCRFGRVALAGGF